jgi:hypothetical protein
MYFSTMTMKLQEKGFSEINFLITSEEKDWYQVQLIEQGIIKTNSDEGAEDISVRSPTGDTTKV